VEAVHKNIAAGWQVTVQQLQYSCVHSARMSLVRHRSWERSSLSTAIHILNSAVLPRAAVLSRERSLATSAPVLIVACAVAGLFRSTGRWRTTVSLKGQEASFNRRS